MSFDLERIKKIGSDSKSLVFGFIRESYHDLIPDLVGYTCLLFYACLSLFEENLHSKNLELSGFDKNTVTKISNDYSYQDAAYTTEWIPSDTKQVYKWKIRNNGPGLSLIGIISDRHHQCINKDIDADGCYLITSSGILYENGGSSCGVISRIRRGHIFTLTLDLNAKEIRGYIDEHTEYVLFDEIETGTDIKYKLALSMRDVNASLAVTLEKDYDCFTHS